jgi:uncharacterized protein YndB with AHSA1/START domain
MLIRILIAVAAVILVFVLVAATRPAAFTITRSTNIAAPPAVVYAQVADLSKWPAWSPWAQLDPNQKVTYSGTPGQPGSGSAWSGNNKVGEGRMTLTEVRPPELVDIKLEFIRPFEATNQSTFNLAPSGPGTQVTWSMNGHNNFMSKAFSIFMNMDKMVGGDFERGLASLKEVSEMAAKAVPPPAPAQPAAEVAPSAVAPAATATPPIVQ